MRKTSIVVAGLAPLTLMSAAADASVQVTFVNPQDYNDRDFRSSGSRDGIIAEFQRPTSTIFEIRQLRIPASALPMRRTC